MKKRSMNCMESNLYKIFPLSDSAITIDFGNVIDENINDIVMQLFQYCINNPFMGMKEAMPAYASLTIFYDVFSVRKKYTSFKTAYAFVEDYLIKSCENISEGESFEKRTIEIPVVYAGEDLSYVADYHQISEVRVVELHTTPTYRVYMMGFLPGFAYMGGLDTRIATPRRATPRMKVPAGSVGIAGSQTGIYPSESPGGWQLIGRTELQLYTPNADEITLLKAGDLVKFMAL